MNFREYLMPGVRAWADKFHETMAKLKAAVNAMGNSPKYVELCLKKIAGIIICRRLRQKCYRFIIGYYRLIPAHLTNLVSHKTLFYCGEFVGMVADNSECKIQLKAFHCEIINDHAALEKEMDSYQENTDATPDRQRHCTAELYGDQTGCTVNYPN